MTRPVDLIALLGAIRRYARFCDRNAHVFRDAALRRRYKAEWTRVENAARAALGLPRGGAR